MAIKKQTLPQQSDEGIRTLPRPECYLCGTQGAPLYEGLRDRLFGAPGTWDLKKCPSPDCGLIWLDPMPVEGDIDKAYRAYYTHEGADTKRRTLFRRLLRKPYRLLLRAMQIRKERKRLDVMYLDKVQPGTLLEVGCGNGKRLSRMQSCGWIVQGQEIDSQAVAQARTIDGLTVHLAKLEHLALQDNTVDAVIMNHVIEHVHDPVSLLAECHRIMKPNGKLVVVTPNCESYGHRYFGRAWRGLEPPRHLHLFSYKTLGTIASKAGFRECGVWTTVANAEGIAQGSADIEQAGQHVIGDRASVGIELRSMLFQIRAALVCMIDKHSGEECVLMAQK